MLNITDDTLTSTSLQTKSGIWRHSFCQTSWTTVHKCLSFCLMTWWHKWGSSPNLGKKTPAYIIVHWLRLNPQSASVIKLLYISLCVQRPVREQQLCVCVCVKDEIEEREKNPCVRHWLDPWIAMPNRGDNDNAALIASLRARAEKDSAQKKKKPNTYHHCHTFHRELNVSHPVSALGSCPNKGAL